MKCSPKEATGDKRNHRLIGALVAAVVALIASATIVAPAAAQVDGVDLQTAIDVSSPGSSAAGAPTSIHVSVSNLGTQPATNVQLTMRVPAGATFVPVSQGLNCSASPGVVTCSVGFLGSSSGLSTSLLVSFATPGPASLTLEASSDQSNSDTPSATTVAVGEEDADLEVLDRTERGLAGQTHRVEFIVWNRGPTDSGQHVLTGAIPAGVEMVPGSLSVGFGYGDLADDLCTVTTTGFTCDPYPGIQANTGQEVSYELAIPEGSGPLETSVTVAGRNDPDAANDTGTLTLEVDIPRAELRVDLIAFGPTPAAEPFEIQLWTWNNGDGAASDVVSTVRAPVGWAFSAPTNQETGRSCSVSTDATSIECTYDTIAPNTRRTLRALLTPPDGTGSGQLTAETSTPTPEFGTDPNTDSREIAYAPTGIDVVAVSATHDPSQPSPRSPESTVITWDYQNATPDRLGDGIEFSVAMPDGASATSMFVHTNGSGSFCNIDPSDRNPTCTLELREITDIAIELRVRFAVGGSYTFTATATQANEQSPGDETLSHTVDVPLLDLTTTPSTQEATVGETYQYIARVRNDGPEPLVDVDYHDTVPAGVELVSARHGWFGTPCDTTTAIVCDLPDLDPGRWTFVVVVARPVVAGVASSAPTSSATSSGRLPSAAASVTINAVDAGQASPVDLRMDTIRSDAVVVGQSFERFVNIRNRSARTATDVVVEVDTGPATNLEVVAARFGWLSIPCETTETIACTIPDITAGESNFVFLTMRATAPGPYRSSVTATAAQAELNPADNTRRLNETATAPP